MPSSSFFTAGTSVKGQESNITILTRLNCAHGLADLATRKYKSAAKHFLSANLDHCDIPDLMSTANVATYGGICALATFDRAELQKQVISSSSFKLFLELDPLLREVQICRMGYCIYVSDVSVNFENPIHKLVAFRSSSIFTRASTASA